ncbi:MAG: 2-dehydropantoate 2-reductase [Verrucomicrobiota bacterium]
MKIAIVGCGAVGSYYGAKLARAGQEVHFLLRSDYDVVRRRGVFIYSPEGDFNIRPKCARTPEEIGRSDLVIVALKTTANDQFSKLLPPLVGPETAVLTLQNGLGNEDELAKLFAPDQIMGGLCFVCLNRTEPGVTRHIGHGMVVLGEFQRWPEPRTHDVASHFRNAGVTCKVTDNLLQAHWEKLVWNIPFNGLGVASAAGWEALNESHYLAPKTVGPCLTTDKLLADVRWSELVRQLMLEVIRIGNALGCAISETLADKQIDRTRTMGSYRASTLIDFERGQRLELESLFLAPLHQAKRAGVAAPKLEQLCGLLQALSRCEESNSGRPS